MATGLLSKQREIYPKIKIAYPKTPNRMWAFPIFGGLAKIIILIPVFVEISLLSVFDIFIIIINSFVVLFTGKYWDICFNFNLGLMRLIAKTTFFFSGFTDSYPGFDFQNHDFSVDIEKPQNSNRAFAVPLFGGLARFILLIPFGIFSMVISNASRIGVVISSVPVFFSGKYPEATFELAVDATRLNFAQLSYFLGIRDNYPNFFISMKHKNFKLVLIAIALIITFFQMSPYKLDDKVNNVDFKFKQYQQNDYPKNYPQNLYR